MANIAQMIIRARAIKGNRPDESKVKAYIGEGRYIAVQWANFGFPEMDGPFANIETAEMIAEEFNLFHGK